MIAVSVFISKCTWYTVKKNYITCIYTRWLQDLWSTQKFEYKKQEQSKMSLQFQMLCVFGSRLIALTGVAFLISLLLLCLSNVSYSKSYHTNALSSWVWNMSQSYSALTAQCDFVARWPGASVSKVTAWKKPLFKSDLNWSLIINVWFSVAVVNTVLL